MQASVVRALAILLIAGGCARTLDSKGAEAPVSHSGKQGIAQPAAVSEAMVLQKCRQPTTIALGRHVPMVFCTVPAMYGMSSFQIAQFEVTQLQYKTVMDAEPWRAWKGRSGAKDEHGIVRADHNPAVYLSNDDAAVFARRLNHLDETASYRLPTEDEWESAANGGTEGDFYWGEEFKAAGLRHSDYAYCERPDLPAAQDVRFCPDPMRQAREPGYCANAFGLMHMLGNVWEWTGTVTMGDAGRIIRGGGWYGGSRYCRSSVHSYGNAYYRDIGLGFRPVRIFPDKSSSIPDRAALTLVVLAPEHTAGDKATLELIETFTREHGSSNRTFKRALFWAVADKSEGLQEEARKVLAWQSIFGERPPLTRLAHHRWWGQCSGSP